jgi:hypothetical protein
MSRVVELRVVVTHAHAPAAATAAGQKLPQSAYLGIAELVESGCANCGVDVDMGALVGICGGGFAAICENAAGCAA